MNNPNEEATLFTRRAFLLAGGKVLLSSALIGRMAYLQIFQREHYTTLARENRIKIDLLTPERGRIYDRFGRELAVNQKNYRVVIEKTQELRKTVSKLAKLLDIDPAGEEKILRTAEKTPAYVPINIRENLSWDEISAIEVMAPELPGTMIEEGSARFYPLQEAAAHVIGYVQAAKEGEAKRNKIYKLPGFKIGRTGIERVFDQAMQGRPGHRQVEINAHRRVVRELETTRSQKGEDIHLSLDAKLQKYTAERLSEEKSAAAVVMDNRTGEILSLVSWPSFDTNHFTQGLDHRTWAELTSNPYGALNNKVINGQYPPGSIFKLIVAIAALEEGIVAPNHRISCTGYMKFGEHPFHCHAWNKNGHGRLTLVEALKHSCDIYFYEIALKLGIEKIAAVARKFGFGQITGITLPNESKGLVPTKSWKQRRFGTAWQASETLQSGIGQGFLLATPLQMAVMMARITNGGYRVQPWMMAGEGIKASESEAWEATPQASRDLEPLAVKGGSLKISQNTLKVILEATNQAVNAEGGSSYRARITDSGFEMGGKSSTAQVKRISIADRESGNLVSKNWKERDHSLFVGYAPIHNPRFVTSVIVEHGGWGGQVAAPIGRDLLLMAQKCHLEGGPGK